MPTPEQHEELNLRLECVEAQRNGALADSAIHYGRWKIALQALDKVTKERDEIKRTLAATQAKLEVLEAQAPPQVQEA